MNALDINRITRNAPYGVWQEDGEYIFETDYNIVYAVDFKSDAAFDQHPAYWLGLTNYSTKPSPNDPKLRATVICIIEEFFRTNPDILLYICDTADDQQAQRDRLFLRWFNGAKQREHYYIKTAQIKDEDVMNYIAIIVPRSHPALNQIIAHFDEEVKLFQENKP